MEIGNKKIKSWEKILENNIMIKKNILKRWLK